MACHFFAVLIAPRLPARSPGDAVTAAASVVDSRLIAIWVCILWV